MSYTGRDYFKDLGRAIAHRDASYLAEWGYALRSLPQTWRCRVGIHWSEFDVERGRSWSEPGEPGWGCAECDEDVFPVRIRFLIWLEEKTPWGPLNARWFQWRHPHGIVDNREVCLRHGVEWGQE